MTQILQSGFILLSESEISKTLFLSVDQLRTPITTPTSCRSFDSRNCHFLHLLSTHRNHTFLGKKKLLRGKNAHISSLHRCNRMYLHCKSSNFVTGCGWRGRRIVSMAAIKKDHTLSSHWSVQILRRPGSDVDVFSFFKRMRILYFACTFYESHALFKNYTRSLIIRAHAIYKTCARNTTRVCV